MDYRLSTINGIEAMKEMLKVNGETKFIFISADASVQEEALKAGAMMFLVKPVTMKDVINWFCQTWTALLSWYFLKCG